MSTPVDFRSLRVSHRPLVGDVKVDGAKGTLLVDVSYRGSVRLPVGRVIWRSRGYDAKVPRSDPSRRGRGDPGGPSTTTVSTPPRTSCGEWLSLPSRGRTGARHHYGSTRRTRHVSLGPVRARNGHWPPYRSSRGESQSLRGETSILHHCG